MVQQGDSLFEDKHSRNTFQEIEEEPEIEPATFDGLVKAIRKQPLNKAIYRKILIHLKDESTTEEMEEFISSLPEFKYAVQPEGRFLEILERAGGVERVGQVPVEMSEDIIAADEATLGSDTIDASSGSRDRLDSPSDNDLSTFSESSPHDDEPFLDRDQACNEEDGTTIQGVIWKTTGLGEEYLEKTQPSERLHNLFEKESDRIDEYKSIMKACAESPKKLPELISELERGKAERGSASSVHPSVYLDRLESAGMITWDEAWTLTDEGRSCLEEIL